MTTLNKLFTQRMCSTKPKYDFSGKVALVTGSSSGIGAAIAIQLAQYGARVTITGRDVANLDKVAQQIVAVSQDRSVKPLQIVGDLLDDSLPKRLVQETVTEFGQLDILVNNAGGASANGTLASQNLMEEFDQVIKLNLRSVVALIQLAVPHLEKTQGNVINISSVSSVKPWTIPYSASKAALDMVTKTSALELGPKQIRVNSINPGPVVTSFNRSLNVPSEVYHKYVALVTEGSLMKRIGQAEDIANLASFLASDDARNITGSIMFSDSGALLYYPNLNKEEVEKK